VLVLDGPPDLVLHGLADDVFELDMVLVPVLEGAVVRVEVVEPVVVLVCKADSVCIVDPVDVFDVLTVFVEVIDAVVVLVDVVDMVSMFVGNEERVCVVVFVEVLDCVGERDSMTPLIDRAL
jgi:hypothetical protein